MDTNYKLAKSHADLAWQEAQKAKAVAEGEYQKHMADSAYNLAKAVQELVVRQGTEAAERAKQA